MLDCAMTLLVLAGVCFATQIPVVMTHQQLELVEGVATVHNGVSWTVSNLGYAHMIGDDNLSNARVVATRDGESATADLGRVHSQPMDWVVVLDQHIALESVAAYSKPGKAFVVVSDRAWAAEGVLQVLTAAKEQSVDDFDAQTRGVLMHLRHHGDLFVGKPSAAFVDALGPSEEAWGAAVPAGELHWEIGVLPDNRRSAPPMLVVEEADGKVKRVGFRLAR
jgi:hypothetical protein